jgi:hypothetical protein
MSKERPILFSAPMIRAILGGKKTQTRRVVKQLCGCPDFYCYKPEDQYPYYFRRKDAVWDSFKTLEDLARNYCPYGATGNRLWVRETWLSYLDMHFYRATDLDLLPDPLLQFESPAKWHPSIHMPRNVSRINLLVTRIRVKRLQDLTEADAISEGIHKISNAFFSGKTNKAKDAPVCFPSAVESFQDLWDSINLKRGCGWETNPYVWVVNFERIL